MEDEKRLKELTTEQTEFKREIGVFGGVSIIGGIMIGSGIFYLGSYVLQRTGMNCGLALICWIIAGIISLFGGLCYAELGTAMPKAGGRVVYLNEAFHPVVGFTAGFTDWLVGGPGSIAAVAIALMEVLRSFFDISGFGIKMGAIVLIVALTAYNLVGVKIASVVQSLSMIAKLVPVGIVMLVALFVGRISPDLSLGQASDYAAANDTSVLGMIAIAVVASLWAYEGWTNLNTVAEEIKNPKRNLPLALIIGIGGVTVLYTLFNFAIMKVLPHEQIVAMINAEDLYLGTAVAEKVLGSAGAVVVSIGMILAMFGTANGMVLAQPRMYYAMAEEGHFFKSFAKLHPKYKVPYAPIIVQGVLSIALVLMRNLDQLTNLVVVVAMIYNALVILAVPILRKKYPNIERPYKVWGGKFTIYLTSLMYVVLMVNEFIDAPKAAITGVGITVAGLIVYLYFKKKNGGEEYKGEGIE